MTVISNFLGRAPFHQFHFDYHLCSRWGLNVAEMVTAESDRAKSVTTTLNKLTEVHVICPNISGHRRLPLFRYYPYTPTPDTVVVETAASRGWYTWT